MAAPERSGAAMRSPRMFVRLAEEVLPVADTVRVAAWVIPLSRNGGFYLLRQPGFLFTKISTSEIKTQIMIDSAKSITAAGRVLDLSDFDIAAGMREDTVNDFFAAHWKTQSASQDSIYNGKGELPEVKIKYAYAVESPAAIDFAPLSKREFAAVYRSWLHTVPDINQFLTLPEELPPAVRDLGTAADAPPQPNVQTVINKIKITIDAEPEGEPPIHVEITVGMKVTGFVETYRKNGRVVLRIIPLAARITDQGKFLSELDTALAGISVKKLRLSSTDRSDSDCTSLRRLIIHIANTLLASKISQFVKEFELPVPIRLFEGLAITDLEVQVVENLLVVFARISDITNKGFDDSAKLLAELDSLLRLSLNDLVNSKDQVLGVVRQVRALSTAKDAPVLAESEERLNAFPNRGVFLMLHVRLLQKIADKFLAYSRSEEKCDGWWIFRFCYDWAIRVWDPKVRLENNRVRVSAKLQGGGGAKVCIETHCGDVCHRIGASAQGEPPLIARVFFRKMDQKTEMWVDPDLAGPFKIDWKVDGLPWPFNKFVEWFLEALSLIGEIFLAIWLYRFKVKLTSLPQYFPGTSFEYEAKFDTDLAKVPNVDALVGLGEIDFKPDL